MELFELIIALAIGVPVAIFSMTYLVGGGIVILDCLLDRRRRVDVHHYHHIAPQQPAHYITIEPAPRPRIAPRRTVAYPVAAREPERLERR